MTPSSPVFVPLAALASLAFACSSSTSEPGTTTDASTHDGASPDGATSDGASPGDSSSPGDSGDPTRPDGGALPPPWDAAAPTCSGPADCRLFQDTCGTCKCIALGATAPDPTCNEPPVSCLVDPCQGKTAACNGGTCAVQ